MEQHGEARMNSRGAKEKTVHTLLGKIRFARSAYACPRCGNTRYPGDEELDVSRTGYSPKPCAADSTAPNP